MANLKITKEWFKLAVRDLKTAKALINFGPEHKYAAAFITGARLELLSNIKLMKPHSIQELARMVKRDFKNVYQDIQLLAEFGLIELKESGPRKSAEPIAKYSEIILAA